MSHRPTLLIGCCLIALSAAHLTGQSKDISFKLHKVVLDPDSGSSLNPSETLTANTTRVSDSAFRVDMEYHNKKVPPFQDEVITASLTLTAPNTSLTGKETSMPDLISLDSPATFQVATQYSQNDGADQTIGLFMAGLYGDSDCSLISLKSGTPPQGSCTFSNLLVVNSADINEDPSGPKLIVMGGRIDLFGATHSVHFNAYYNYGPPDAIEIAPSACSGAAAASAQRPAPKASAVCYPDNITAVQVTYDPVKDPRGAANGLVPGKSAYLRVFLKSKGQQDVTSGISGTLGLPADLNPGPAVAITPQNSKTAVARTSGGDSQDIDSSLNFRVISNKTDDGEHVFHVQVLLNGQIQQDEDVALYFTKPGTSTDSYWPGQLSIGYFLLCSPTECPADHEGAGTFANKIFPLRDDDGVTYAQVLPNQIWNKQIVNPATGHVIDNAAMNLTKAVALIYSLIDSAKFASADLLWDQPIDQLVAWAPANLVGRGLEQFPGITGNDDGLGHVWWTLSLPDTLTNSADQGPLLAHALSHNFGLAEGLSQYTGQGAFDVQSYQIPRLESLSLMNSFLGGWPSAAEYDQLQLSYAIDPGPGKQADVTMIRQIGGPAAMRPRASRAAAAAQAAEYLIISGDLSPDRTIAKFDSGFRVTAATPGSSSDPYGSHCIRFDGNSANDYCFNPIYLDPSTPGSAGGFVVKAPFPAGASSVALVRRDPAAGETVLTQLSAASDPPSVTILSPANGMTWMGTQTIQWAGSDPAGNPLTYVVQYSPDNGATWTPLTFPLTDTQYDVDSSQIAGSQVLIRVLASNGLMTGTAVVGPITLLQSLKFDLSTTAIDFGSVALNGGPVDQTLTITNSGTGPLKVSTQLAGDPAFTLAGANVVIWPGKRLTMKVRFNPAVATSGQGTLTLSTPDQTQPPTTVRLSAVVSSSTGGGKSPKISVAPGMLAFPAVTLGRPAATLKFTIGNTGTADLHVQSITLSGSSAFSLVPAFAPLTIVAGKSTDVTVQFAPTAAGAASGSLSIASDDAANSLVVVNVSGTANAQPSGVVGCVTAPANLVSWWSGDGNANDSNGGNNLTVQGGTTFAPGEVGQAFQFDGSTGYASAGNAANLRFTSALTIEAWINPHGAPTTGNMRGILTKWGQIANDQADSDSYGLWFRNDSNAGLSLFGAIHQNGGKEPHVLGGAIPLNSWTHVALTFDSGTGQLTAYVNGQVADSLTSAGPIFTSSRNVLIGREDSIQPRPFNGLIDEVTVYSRALSGAEIQAIYNAGGAGKCKGASGGGGTLSASPSSLDFGSSSTPVTKTITLNNTTAAAISISQATITPSSAPFVLVSTLPLSIPANGQLAIGVQFTPGAAGPQSATLALGSLAIPLTGTATPTSGGGSGNIVSLKMESGTYDSNSKTFTVTPVPNPACPGPPGGPCVAFDTDDSTSNWALGVSAVGATNPLLNNVPKKALKNPLPAGSYYAYNNDAWTWNTHMRLTVQWSSGTSDVAYFQVNGFDNNTVWTRVGGAANLSVTYKVIQPYVCKVYFGSTQPPPGCGSSNQVFELHIAGGSSGGGPTGGGGGISVSPQSLDFGQVTVGQSSQSKTVTITNTGSSTATVNLSTTPAFAVSPSSLSLGANGATATASVTFAPAAPGAVSGTLMITAPGQPNPAATVALTGTGSPSMSGGGGCVTAPANLVSWWSGDGNANDSNGGNNLTVQGGTTFAPGEAGQAFQFDGNTGYASAGNAANLRFTSALTIEAWINPRTAPTAGNMQGILTKWGQIANDQADSDSYGLWFRNDATAGLSLFGAIHQSGGKEPHVLGGAIPLNTWTHVAVTFDSATGQLTGYVNGQVVDSLTSAGPIFTSSRNVLIGREDSSSPRPFNGLIDEVTVYSRALSGGEIQGIYNAGAAGKCKGASGGGGTLSASPSSLDFGSSSTPVTKTITLNNTTAAAISISQATITPSSTPFALVTTLPLTIPANGQLAIGVQFTPGAAGVQSATLALGSLSIPLTGTATAASGGGGSGNIVSLKMESGTYDSNSKTFTVTPVPNPTCPGPPGGPCVAFDTDDSTGNWALGVSAVGVTNPLLNNVPKKALKNPLPGGSYYTYNNNAYTWNTHMRLTVQWSSGTSDVAYFQVSGMDDNTVWPRVGGAPNLSVTYKSFQQSVCKVYFGSTQPPGNCSLSNQVFQIDITGGSAGGGPSGGGGGISVSPQSLDFGQVTVGQSSQSKSVTITNAGGSTATVNLSTLAPFAVLPTSLTLAANGGTGTAFVLFSPTSPASAASSLNITVSGQSTPAASVTLAGTGASAGGGGGTGGACAAPPANLVSWWPAEGNPNDVTGGITGSVLGGTTFATGEVGKAFQFDGSTGYVSMGSPASLRFTAALTIEAWINPKAAPPSSGGANMAAVLTKWGQQFNPAPDTDSYGLWLRNNSGALTMFAAIHLPGTSEPNLQGGTIALNTWTHVAMTFDSVSGQFVLYVNGQAVGSLNAPGAIATSTRNVFIGREDSSQPRPFNGLIDEVSVYGRALSASEIQRIYTAGGAGKCRP